MSFAPIPTVFLLYFYLFPQRNALFFNAVSGVLLGSQAPQTRNAIEGPAAVLP